MVFLLGYWGSLNSALVKWDLMVFPAQDFALSTIMAVLLLGGFIIGMLTTVYLASKVKFSNSLKKRKAERQNKKITQSPTTVNDVSKAQEKPSPSTAVLE
jgi:uncharacterized membrane protein YciS (DUF1049 family)